MTDVDAAQLLKNRLENQRAQREIDEQKTGDSFLHNGGQPDFCPHGSDMTKWSYTVPPCQHCMVLMIMKQTICFAKGHATSNSDEVGYLMKTDPYGDGEARQADSIYKCSRCGALTTS